MGGKSRKTGGISKKLIDRIKKGEKLDNNKSTETQKTQGKEKPFHLSLKSGSTEGEKKE